VLEPGPSALDAWILAVSPRAIAFARSLLRNPSDAEDIVQDCFCRLIARQNVYDLPRDGTKLLYRAITHACINRTTRERTMVSLTRPHPADSQPLDIPDGQAVRAEEHVAAKELHEAIQRALSLLAPMQRAAVELKSLGYSQQEVAEMLSITPSHAGVLIHRGRHALALQLAPYLNEESTS
jgi:RNA polymerase sigma-70 factor (ECF subfamily)